MSLENTPNVTVIDPCVDQNDPLRKPLTFTVPGVVDPLVLRVDARAGGVVFVAANCRVPKGCRIVRYSGYQGGIKMEDFTFLDGDDVVIEPSEYYWLSVTTPEGGIFRLFMVRGVFDMGEKGMRVVFTFEHQALPPDWVRRGLLPDGDHGVLRPRSPFEQPRGFGG